ncbi:glycine cleavage system aminomethyltransferase GcvT [Lichenicola sp.]|uniref:glycine cleavage system aminomethyltransferase GcvT n=1 Tax=Lichenicola sp. TaxID=2804529 RepID=UPI003B00D653
MVPFAGYSMPLQYSSGIMTEHLHTRSACGLFDVSHMGQIRLRPHSGVVRDAALALERLVPADMASLLPGRQRYALLTNPAGGVMDDLMVANLDDSLLLVVNASCKAADLAHLEQHLSGDCAVEPLFDRGLLALQGPGAEAALSVLDPGVASMRFMDVRTVLVDGQACSISRSGYTGEDGYEIGMPAALAEPIARLLLAQPGVLPVGLGARDSLRLEAGLCLYGNDLDVTTTPIEASLEWAIQKSRRYGGARAGGFPGADIILRQLVEGTRMRRVGLSPEGRAPLRLGAALFSPDALHETVGHVSSGAFGPSLQAPLAMGYVPTALAQPGTALVAELRGRHVPVTVCPMPFVPPNFKR